MITDSFLGMLGSFFEVIGELFSGISLPSDFSVFDGVFKYFRMAMYFLPMGDVLPCLGIVFALNNYQLIIKIFKLVKDFIRL